MEEPVSGASDEQIPGEGGEDETGVIPPAGSEPEVPDDPAPEAPAEPVTDPAPETPADPEAPAEEPAPETPAEEPAVEEPVEEEVEDPALDDAEINAEEATTYTVSIASFDDVKAYITANATVGGNRDKSFARTGSLTAAKNAAVVVTITAKSGAKITSVKNGETAVSAVDDTYTITLSSLAADASITVEAASAYSLTTELVSGVTGIKLDASLKDAAGAANDAALTVTAAEIAQGADLKFTLVGTEAGTDARYNVFYAANGSDEKTAIEAVKETVGTAPSTTEVDTYTVKKEDLADFHSIKIIVEKETKVDFTDALAAVTNVDIVYWGTKKSGGAAADPAEAWVEGDNAAKYDPIKKAYVGETFKFKAAVKTADKDTKAITKVTRTVNGEKTEITAAEGGVYSFTVEENTTAFTVETDYVAAKMNTLTYTLKDTCDKDSVVSAKITKIVAGSTTADTADAIKNFLGGKNHSDVLKAGEAVSILKASGEDEITEIQVTVTPAADYKVVKGAADKHITIAAGDGTGPAVYKFTKTAGADSIAIAAAMSVTVETDVVETAEANEKFFMVSRDKGSEASPKNTHISDPVVTLLTDKVEAVPTSASDTTTKAYKVKGGVKTVEFTVTADAGYTLKDYADYTGFKSIKEEAAGEGKVKYTVTLFASKITGASADDAAANPIAVEEEGIKLAAEVKPGSGEEGYGNFSVGAATYTEKGTGKTPQSYTFGNEDIPYGSKLTTEITAVTGCHLVSVSYNMGGTDTPVTLSVDGKAAVVIPEVTAKVTINVTAEKDYQKIVLQDKDGNAVTDKTGDVYNVRYDEAYLVGLTNGNVDVPVKDFKAVVKDETGAEVKLPRITTGTKLKIDLARAKTSVAGQTITIDMVVGDKVVDTYILSVNKKTSKLTIEGETKAEKEQRVDSTVKYAIDTDGERNALDITPVDEGNILSEVNITETGLEVKLAPMTTTQITKTAASADGKTPAVYHSATITLTSDDDPDLEASIVVTAKPFIEDITNKEITLAAGDQADTLLNVTLGLDGVAVPENGGELYYELTVTPKPATGTTLSDKLLSTVTVAPVTKRGDSQNVQIPVAKSTRLGEGAACDYEVKAKLTYSTGSGTESTKEMTSTDFKTIDGKEIKYENNLKLVKDKSFKGTLYTGQSNEIVIANPKWSTKNVTYKILSDGITDEVKYDANGNRQTGLTVRQNASGQIVVTNVPQYTWLGRHTITVEATADQTTAHEMYKSRATITVTVAKGIEDILVHTPASEKIYKKDAKSKATLKMTAVLNDFSDSSADWSWDGKKYTKAPKSKSLKWELVGAGSFEGSEVALPESFGNKAVTINAKSGAITVDKKFALSKNKANNRFCVKATATDYAGNTTVGYSTDIEITGDALSIEKVALVRATETENEGEYNYEVVAVQNANNEELKLDATAVQDTFVIVVPKGVNLVKEYNNVQWATLSTKLIDPANYSVTSGGKKVVEVRSGNYLKVLAAGKKVKLTVAANDGSRQKRVLPLNLGWTGAEKDLALGIRLYGSETYNVFNPTSEYKALKDKTAIAVKDITATGAVRLIVQLMEGDKSDGSSTTFNEADRYINYKLAAKGGKITYTNGTYANVVTTSKVTTLTLTVGTGRDAKKSVYTITNKAYALDGKAPKVTVKGSLHESGHKSEQQLTMTVKNGNEFYGKKAAKVEIDWSSANQKNSGTLNWLNETLTNNVIQLNEKTGEMTLAFADPEGEDYIGFTPGSYKLKVTVGTGTTVDNFKAETLPANATLKVVKNKTFTFKPQTSYTIGKIDGGAILTGKSNAAKGEKTYMNFYELKNANVAGRPNDFTHYFTIEYDPINNTQRLTLNEDDAVFKAKFGITDKTPLNWDTIDLTKIDKKDLTGYVSYDARASKKFYGIGTNGWTNTVTGTVKITVKLAANPKNDAWKASLKYTTNKAEVLAKDNEKAVINVMSGNEYVTIAHAVVYETDNLKADAINEKGQLLIAVKGVEAKKTYTTSMKVVPYSSRFESAVDAVKADKTKYMAAIEKYGIPVKVSIVAKATAAEVTAAPDPVTVASAINLIYANPNPWTAKLTAANLTVNGITTAEKNAAKNALATEVSNYLKTHALKAYNTGFTVTGTRVITNGYLLSQGYAYVVLTIQKGSDLDEFDILIEAKQGGSTPPTPTVTAGDLKDAIAGLTVTVAQADMNTSSSPATIENATAKTAIETAITTDGSITMTGYTLAVTGVTVTTQPTSGAAGSATDGAATATFTVTNDDDASDTATGSVSITITATVTS